MKLFIFTLLFSISAFAVENWFPIGKEGAKTVWMQKAKCEKAEGQACYDISKKDPRFHEPQTSMVDNPAKPIYKPKYDFVNCDSPSDCTQKAGSKTCLTGDHSTYEKNQMPIPGYSLYCVGITGYEQMEQTVLVENSAKKTEVQASEAQKEAMDLKLEKLAKDAQFGSSMIGLVGVRLRDKNLTRAQTKQVMKDYRELIDLLKVGSIEHSKAEVESITPDGTLISQGDKDALLAEINAYLGQ